MLEHCRISAESFDHVCLIIHHGFECFVGWGEYSHWACLVYKFEMSNLHYQYIDSVNLVFHYFCGTQVYRGFCGYQRLSIRLPVAFKTSSSLLATRESTKAVKLADISISLTLEETYNGVINCTFLYHQKCNNVNNRSLWRTVQYSLVLHLCGRRPTTKSLLVKQTSFLLPVISNEPAVDS